MGRKKLEIKRIESKSSRQVTFTKRRNGLIKKAKELSVLCDVEVALIIFSGRGKLYNFSSPSNSLEEIIQRYNSHVESEGNASTLVCDTEQDHSQYGSFMTVRELLETVERRLEDPDHLTMNDFTYLENQLEGALLETRARKTHLMMAAIVHLEEKEKMLREDNRLLEEEIALNRGKVEESNAESDSLHNRTPQTLTFL